MCVIDVNKMRARAKSGSPRWVFAHRRRRGWRRSERPKPPRNPRANLRRVIVELDFRVAPELDI